MIAYWVYYMASFLKRGDDRGITKAHAAIPRIPNPPNEAAGLAEYEAEHPQHRRSEASELGSQDHLKWFTCKQRIRVSQHRRIPAKIQIPNGESDWARRKGRGWIGRGRSRQEFTHDSRRPSVRE